MTLPDAAERRQIAINIGPWLVGTIRAVTVSGILGIFGVIWTSYNTLSDHTNVMRKLVEGQEAAKKKIESMEIQIIERVEKDEQKYDTRYAGIQTDVSSIQRDLAVLRQRQTDDIERVDAPPRRPSGGKGQ